jgi:hypothetical protein
LFELPESSGAAVLIPLNCGLPIRFFTFGDGVGRHIAGTAKTPSP